MEDVNNEDVFELIEETSANKPFRQEVIPKGYEIEQNHIRTRYTSFCNLV